MKRLRIDKCPVCGDGRAELVLRHMESTGPYDDGCRNYCWGFWCGAVIVQSGRGAERTFATRCPDEPVAMTTT